MRDKVIAIDGPSGSGKSTIAKIIASKLSLTYLDTGAMFRAIAYHVSKLNIDFSKAELTDTESSELEACLSKMNFEYGVDERTLIRIDNEDLTQKIREHFVSELASKTSKFPIIRNYLKSKQRDIAKLKPSVLEGRDIGTVIFPNAAVKIFLTASSEIRAQRRFDQLVEINPENSKLHSVESILKDIKLRDDQDQSRETAPLKKADNAIELDTTAMDIEEVVNAITNEYNNKKELFI